MRLEQQATFISTITAFILVVIKFIIGVFSGSVAVLASAIDSLLDMIISLFNYFTLKNSDRAPDDRFNFGRSKLEPLAAVIEGTIISLSALFILYSAISKMIQNSPIEYLDYSIYVIAISFIITAFLVIYLNYVAKKTDNMVIKADALHYKTDLFSNGAILFSLIAIHFSGFHLIDAILGIIIAFYMIYSAYPIIKEGVLMLLDAALEADEVAKIIEILDNENSISSYHDLRTRKSSNDIYLSVHMVFSVSTSLLDAHIVGDRVELAIKNLFSDKNIYTLIHLDPYDDSETD